MVCMASDLFGNGWVSCCPWAGEKASVCTDGSCSYEDKLNAKEIFLLQRNPIVGAILSHLPGDVF